MSEQKDMVGNKLILVINRADIYMCHKLKVIYGLLEYTSMKNDIQTIR